jgi:hypothetical protein
MVKTHDAIASAGKMFLQEAIILMWGIGLTSAIMAIREMLGDGWYSLLDHGNIHEVIWHSTVCYLVVMTIYETSNRMQRCR